MTTEATPAAVVPSTTTVHASVVAAGFITSMPADMKPATMFRVARYLPAYCAELGGVRGHGIDRRQIKNPRASSDHNPDGLFWEYVIKITAPAPVVIDDETHEVARAEVGSTIVVVLDEQIEAIEPFFEAPEWCAELAFVPFKKMASAKKMAAPSKKFSENTPWEWGFKVYVSDKHVLRSEVIGKK